MELTILMPCLNEEETVGACVSTSLRFLSENSIHGEVVVSDNGSTDQSVEIARSAGARVVRTADRGYGAALMNGIERAQGQYVIMGDADDSYDFSSLGPFIARLRDGADLVMGNRFAGGILPGAMPPLHRYLGNPILSKIGRVFFKSNVRDFHCGLRGFRRASILELNLLSTGMEFASEMVVKAMLSGLRVEEVPTVLRPDGRSRRPHLRTWRDGWRHLRFLLLYSPRWLFLYPGVLLTGFGAIMSARLSVGTLTLGTTVFDVNSLLTCVALTIVGSQALWFAVLTKAYAGRVGLLPIDRRIQRVQRYLRLETVLTIGVGGFMCGLAGLVTATNRWRAAGWGRSIPPRVFDW